MPNAMKEFREGRLHSGSKHGPIVTDPAQARAIQISEARKAGAHIPMKKAEHTDYDVPIATSEEERAKIMEQEMKNWKPGEPWPYPDWSVRNLPDHTFPGGPVKPGSDVTRTFEQPIPAGGTGQAAGSFPASNQDSEVPVTGQSQKAAAIAYDRSYYDKKA